MHLFAAFVLPPHVLDEVERAVSRADEPAMAASRAAQDHRAGPLGRLLGRGRETAGLATHHTDGKTPGGPQLNRVPASRMLLPITKFGNLPLSEANRLEAAFRRTAQDWAAPRLRLSGGAALEWPGDESVWVKLDGDPEDLEALHVVTNGVQRVSQGLQLFVDRRIFHPMLEVGRINRLTTPAYLERLVEDLDAHTGSAWWQTTLSLLVPAVAEGGRRAPHKLFAEIPLGPAVAH